MTEYIEREALLNRCGWYNTFDGKSICAVRKDEISTLPAADVVEVKRGRWIWDERFHDYTCSECHNWDLKTPNYCSNCGADMREVVDHA